jgi:glutathione S-transferase
MYDDLPLENLMKQMNQDKALGYGATMTLTSSRGQTIIPSNIFITGSEYSIADIAMFNEIQNVLGIVRMNDLATNLSTNVSKKDQDPIEYKDAIKLKYPCVSAWMKSLENLPIIRQY